MEWPFFVLYMAVITFQELPQIVFKHVLYKHEFSIFFGECSIPRRVLMARQWQEMPSLHS